jgi:hypothetical protein
MSNRSKRPACPKGEQKLEGWGALQARDSEK